jgi:hypothetical protein
MALRIAQNAARPRKNSALCRLPRLLERHFSSRAWYTCLFLQRDLYSAPVEDAISGQRFY